MRYAKKIRVMRVGHTISLGRLWTLVLIKCVSRVNWLGPIILPVSNCWKVFVSSLWINTGQWHAWCSNTGASKNVETSAISYLIWWNFRCWVRPTKTALRILTTAMTSRQLSISLINLQAKGSKRNAKNLNSVSTIEIFLCRTCIVLRASQLQPHAS